MLQASIHDNMSLAGLAYKPERYAD